MTNHPNIFSKTINSLIESMHQRKESLHDYECGCGEPPGSPPCEDAIEFSSDVDAVILKSLQIGFTLGAIRGCQGEITDDEVLHVVYGIDWEDTEKGMEEAFRKLADEWNRETGHLSSMQAASEHPAYQKIIGMGMDAVPLMLEDFVKNTERGPNHWFIALSTITGENPITEEIAGKIQLMADAWVEWGKRNGHLEDDRDDA